MSASSFFCRLLGCCPKVYSAHIDTNQGFDNPAPIPELPGWTVYKMHQTEIYEITHNLGLSNPQREFHVVATPMNMDTVVIAVEAVESNSFRVSTWGRDGNSPTPMGTPFMFIANVI